MTQPRTRLSRILRTFAALTTCALALVTLAMGCSSSNDSTGASCGTGTKLVNATCVPDGTGGTSGSGGTAGSSGTAGSAGSAGSGAAGGGTGGGGGSQPNLSDPCPSDLSQLYMECSGGDNCGSAAVQVACDGGESDPIAFGPQIVDAPFDLFVRIAGGNPHIVDSDCGGEPLAIVVLGIVPGPIDSSGHSAQVPVLFEVGEPWRMIPDFLVEHCYEHATPCVKIGPNMFGSSDTVTLFAPASYTPQRNLHIRTVTDLETCP